MTKELLVAIDISNPHLSKSVAMLAKRITGIKFSSLGDSTASQPDIILIDDPHADSTLINKIRTLSSTQPQASIFVISGNRDHLGIIEAMKAGAAEYLVEPVEDAVLINAIEDVRTKLANAGRLAQGRIFSFISAKGGVGSTVLAVNTATALSMDKKGTVALIDMSLQSGDASVLLDIVPQNTITDICNNINRLDVAFLRGVMCNHSTGLNFLAAPLNPEDSEDIISSHLEKVLRLSRKLYDHVILDCASMHINDISVEAFKQSDKVFLVTDMSVPSIRNTVRLCKLIRKFSISLDKVEIIINRFIKGGALSLAEIEKNFEKPAYWLVPNDFSDIVSSINRGIPLIKMSQGAPFSKNLKQFVKKLQNDLEEHDFRGIRGTFGKAL